MARMLRLHNGCFGRSAMLWMHGKLRPLVTKPPSFDGFWHLLHPEHAEDVSPMRVTQRFPGTMRHDAAQQHGFARVWLPDAGGPISLPTTVEGSGAWQ
ncbi:hypothetical protein [Paracoccus salipaludis]|uniref:hypothetical protein n=1 Tax=Paracoccus salipaludis TaxID=2032623 RepID=UPI00107242D0|nr:hypothetical protein [Paracoccus salipaludis]